MEAKIMETVLSIITCAVMMQMGGWSLRTVVLANPDSNDQVQNPKNKLDQIHFLVSFYGDDKKVEGKKI